MGICPKGRIVPTLSIGEALPVTIDEELTHLDSLLRRLKIEYEVYFNNPTKRPPADLEWKVLALLRKNSDGGRMNFSQRFKYNEQAQRYAVYSDLWRKKMRIREEGYRRPQDALLSVQGVREAEHEQKHHPVYGVSAAAQARAFSMAFTDASAQTRRSRAALQRVGRCQEEIRRSGQRKSRFFLDLRKEEDRSDPKTVRLPGRGVFRRTARWPSEVEGESEDLSV